MAMHKHHTWRRSRADGDVASPLPNPSHGQDCDTTRSASQPQPQSQSVRTSRTKTKTNPRAGRGTGTAAAAFRGSYRAAGRSIHRDGGRYGYGTQSRVSSTHPRGGALLPSPSQFTWKRGQPASRGQHVGGAKDDPRRTVAAAATTGSFVRARPSHANNNYEKGRSFTWKRNPTTDPIETSLATTRIINTEEDETTKDVRRQSGTPSIQEEKTFESTVSMERFVEKTNPSSASIELSRERSHHRTNKAANSAAAGSTVNNPTAAALSKEDLATTTTTTTPSVCHNAVYHTNGHSEALSAPSLLATTTQQQHDGGALKRIGRNKLIVVKNTDLKSISTATQDEKSLPPGVSMNSAKGTSTLSTDTGDNSAKRKYSRKHHNPMQKEQNYSRSSTHRHTQQQRHHHHLPAAKRIRLRGTSSTSTITTLNDEKQEDKNTASAPVEQQEGSSNTPNNKGKSSVAVAAAHPRENDHILTDFAYRATSAPRSRLHGSRHPKNHSRSLNRHHPPLDPQRSPHHYGLCRVPADPTTTRMCTAFLRGTVCTNDRCTKRHDVPHAWAVPVCLFFQQPGGACYRDACPFRHVKVNPLATPVCPSFAALGFCDKGAACGMVHLQQKS